MKKWHITLANLMMLCAIFLFHFIVLSEILDYVPVYCSEFRKYAYFKYPFITIEWHAEPTGGGGGVSMFDITLLIFLIAFLLNIIILIKEALSARRSEKP